MRKLYSLISFLALIAFACTAAYCQSPRTTQVQSLHQPAPATTAQSDQILDARQGGSTLLWAGWIVGVFFGACTLYLAADRRQTVENKDREIADKSKELQLIQEQVNQTNEELMAINANLESIVEERTLKLSKVNCELDMFLYRSSHDLRRPVTTLMGLVEVSKLGFDENTAKYLFSKINDTAVHMDTMLEKFFMINTINHESTEIGEVNFEEILDSVQHSSLVHNYAEQVQFNVVVEPGIRMVSDPQLITFILKNLIDNAIVFRCKDGKRQPVIRIEVRPVGNAVGISVHDNGIGIAETNLSEIFTLFYRGSEASKGNGLGLYVVRKAIEKLSGNITVSSRLNEFTCFHITLTPSANVQIQTETVAQPVLITA
jgi:signal transduction histidine kinase